MKREKLKSVILMLSVIGMTVLSVLSCSPSKDPEEYKGDEPIDKPDKPDTPEKPETPENPDTPDNPDTPIVDPNLLQGSLTVNLSDVINRNIIGGGVNFEFSSYVFINLINGGEWGVGQNRSQHIPFSKDAAELETLWGEYMNVIDKSGMQYVRLNVSFTMWEPVNDNDDPFDTDFKKGFIFSPDFYSRADVTTDTPLFYPYLNAAYLKAFYRLLDHFEEKGMYVILGNWDNGSEALQFCPKNDNWLASVGANGNKLGRGNALNVTNVDEFAETFAAIMYHLIEEKHYTCVKGFSIYNEPENLTNMQGVLTEAYSSCGKQLTRLGIRDKVMIQAFDGSLFWSVSDGTVSDRIAKMDAACDTKLDIISQHMYLSTIESGKKIEGADVRGTISEYLIPDLRSMVGQANGRPVVWGEIGTFAFYEEKDGHSLKNYLSNIFAAEAAIEGFNNGLSGYGLWVWNNYQHNYYTMLAYDGSKPRRITPDKENFYPRALIMSAFPKGTDILSSEVTGCEKGYRHVWACAGKKPDGKISILLVNDGSEKASLELKGLEGKTFSYSYVVERITNQISKEADVSDTVNLSANSIVVLTEK